MELDVKAKFILEEDEKKRIPSCGNTISLIRYLNFKLLINDEEVRLGLEDMIQLIKKLNLENWFRETSLGEIEKIQKYFIDFKDERPIKDVARLYYEDLNISYYPGYFCIVLSDESGRDKLVDSWKKFLDDTFKN